ncbi:MAG: ABC transporter ATP-binding protein [Planctomycetota bacterium]
MIQANRFSKVYDGFQAVNTLSFELPRGAVCGFVGPNGAGKTTTMRCLAGLLEASDGELHIGNFLVQSHDLDVKRRVVYVPDDPPLFDDLSVGDHLELIASIYQTGQRSLPVETWVADFSLAQKWDARGSALSRGMRQKLAILCALVADPDVLLLDEPMTGLDPPAIRQLLQVVGEIAAAGKTVLISSHLLAMIADICTHFLFLSEGQRRFFGTAAELRAAYPDAVDLEAAFFMSIHRDAPEPASC